ncbi:MAG: peptidoglycan DD-metalloendopeptidase family protein [Oscillospiraceae bacterium]
MVKKKIVAVLVLFSMLASLLPAVGAATTSEVDAATQKRNELQQQLVEINKKLADIKDEVERTNAKANTYAERKSIVERQIGALKESLVLKTEELTLKQQELDAKTELREDTYELFKQRTRAMYMNNQATTLSTVLGASTFSEFLVGAEMLRRVSTHDTELIDKLAREQKEIEAAQVIIKEELDSLEADKSSLDVKYSELAALKQEADSALSSAEALKEVTEEDYAQILEEFRKADAEMNKLMGNGDVSYVGGYYAWPVPGFTWISSSFGWRTLYGAPNWHGGIDIAGAGIGGKPIIASNDGRVAVAYPGWTGYGHYVMIDHGGNNWTVYGHMSRIDVYVGQKVKQGEQIGLVGTTGNSTGYHLHFEIRLNGEKVNPINYVSR